jgi:hypothetical protein
VGQELDGRDWQDHYHAELTSDARRRRGAWSDRDGGRARTLASPTSSP